MQKNFFVLLSIVLLILIFFYVFKFFLDATEINYNYYKIHIIFIFSLLLASIFSIFLKKKFQTYIIISLVSILIGSYAFEIFLTFNKPQGSLLKKKIKIYNKTSKDLYDTRSKYEFYKYLKKSDKDVVLAVPPRFYPSKNIYSLSGISNSKTILCNELGQYSLYFSDRYGFNNPDEEWNQESISYLIVGDSFAHGACVNRPNDVGSNLRELSENSVLNLGYSGNGPLEEFATLREYLKENVKNILWLYYPNDLANLAEELKVNILNKYLENSNFTQNLAFKQMEIDEEAKKIIDIKYSTEKKFDLKKLLILNNLRGYIYSLLPIEYLPSYSNSTLVQPTEKFIEILKKTKKLAYKNSSNLFFIYLPEYSQYKDNYIDTNYRNIKKILKNLDISFIDLHELVFKQEENPLSLFPYGLPGHYNKIGYKKISQAIYDFIIDKNR